MRNMLLIPIVVLAVGACERTVTGPASPVASVEAEDLLAITIDIQPFSTQNVINLGTRSHVSVAVIGSDQFDVRTVDPSTARFGPGLATPIHTFTVDSPTDHVRDVNADGVLDMMFHFDKTAAGLYDLAVGQSWLLELTAVTVDGATIAGGEVVKLITNGSPR